MAKPRILDKKFWDDPDVGKLCRDARLLMAAMITRLADDEGRFLVDAGYIRKEVFGYDEDVDREQIDQWVRDIADGFESFYLYQSGKHWYIQIDPEAWHKYQGIRYVKSSRLPAPPTNRRESRKIAEICGNLQRNAASVGLGRVGSEVGECSADADEDTAAQHSADDWNEPDRQQIARDLVAKLAKVHPIPGQSAIPAAERILKDAVDPQGVADAIEKAHGRSMAYWEAARKSNPRLFIPQLWRWLADNDWLHPPNDDAIRLAAGSSNGNKQHIGPRKSPMQEAFDKA